MGKISVMNKIQQLLQLTRDYFLAGVPVIEILNECPNSETRAVVLKEYMRLDVELMLRDQRSLGGTSGAVRC